MCIRDRAWRIEVNQLVVMPVEQIAKILDRLGQIEAPAESGHLAEAMGVAKREVDRVERAEAAPVRDHAGMAVLVPHQRQHFVEQIPFILQVPVQAVARMAPKAVEAFLIDAVHAIQLHVTPLDLVA